MPRLSLSTLLIGGNVGLIVAAVFGVLAAGTGLLQRLAEEQALARVSLAGSSAREIVAHAGGEIVGAAQLLAERPTLGALLAADDRFGLGAYLGQFCRADRLSACAVVQYGTALADDGTGLEWDEIGRATGRPGEAFLLRRAARGGLVLAASAPISVRPAASATVVLALDEAFAATVAEQTGLAVQIRERDAALRPTADPAEAARLPLRSRALDSEALAAGRVDELDVWLAVVPLRSRSGEIAGIVEVTLPTTAVGSSVGRLVRSLLLLSAAVGGVAALFSVLLGRRLVQPLAALTDASSRIGRGDLATPIPRIQTAEIGKLAESMDEMRSRLLELTTELGRRQAQAEAILGGIVEGVYAVDRERRIRYVNPQAAALLGSTPAKILGRFCGDVLNPRSHGGVRPCEDRCPIVHARFRGSTRAVEHLALPGGVSRTVVIASAPPQAGDAADQFQVIRDETEIEATRRLRDAVLANISHEFRTPLTAQLASIELLRDRLPDLAPHEIHDLVFALERGALRLTQLIDNLLESVRIESGKDSIRRRPVALDEVVEAAVDLTSPLAALREQTIEVDLPYPLPPVEGDGPRLTQVFVNLLANANKFAPAETVIRIGGETRPGEVVLWVEDQGPGLAAWDAAPHFERFLRSPGEEPEESGMGLGLWIVKSIVERHGGRVEVRGAAHGTRMCVILPVGGGDEDPGR